MHIAITERFSTLIENDVFKVSAFLDPFFNITAFEPSKREPIVSLIKTLVKAELSYLCPIFNRNRAGEKFYRFDH